MRARFLHVEIKTEEGGGYALRKRRGLSITGKKREKEFSEENKQKLLGRPDTSHLLLRNEGRQGPEKRLRSAREKFEPAENLVNKKGREADGRRSRAEPHKYS